MTEEQQDYLAYRRHLARLAKWSLDNPERFQEFHGGNLWAYLENQMKQIGADLWDAARGVYLEAERKHGLGGVEFDDEESEE